jgi:PKD repeat protein
MKKIITLMAMVVALTTAGMAQSCDTIFNLTSTLDTPTVYLADTGTGAGYLSGNNIYGDFMKAEGFGGIAGDYVTSATLFFGEVTVNPADSNNTVKVYVWDNTGTDIYGDAGAPGNVLDSTTITLKQIAQAVTATYANSVITGVTAQFTGQAALTDSFYVGVVLPTVNGDTIAFFTNIVPPGPDGNGWEYEANFVSGSGNGWGSYNNDYGFTGGSEGNYMVVTICGAAPKAGFGISESYPFKASDSLPCPSVVATFSDSSTGANAWYWSFGDGDTSTQQNPVHFYNTGGTFTVTEIVSNGSAYDTATATVQVAAVPADTLEVTEPGAGVNNGAITVVATGDAPYTYLWNTGATSATITGLSDSLYTVTITGANNCQIISSTLLYVSGINSIYGLNGVKLFPNPATDVLNLQWSAKSNADIAIIDLNGQVVGNFESVGEIKSSLNVASLSPGTYVLRLTNKTNNQQQSTLFSKF